jgi:hypothetical protein
LIRVGIKIMQLIAFVKDKTADAPHAMHCSIEKRDEMLDAEKITAVPARVWSLRI